MIERPMAKFIASVSQFHVLCLGKSMISLTPEAQGMQVNLAPKCGSLTIEVHYLGGKRRYCKSQATIMLRSCGTITPASLGSPS